ncbi:hypothetical protein [Halobiforma nitratireducens]|uniref:Uncharacterized protein n=1 Tax=Halobiforma nitratireducens JCM 10879 TaxID=1227454 RepID=M0MQ75_9EURY|nr:hypothetical protein [Halobiforma nitratireducens]EMA46894.1 hypothetical protein C446_00774 [Halobiforma nitratireducens JCM 10879]
MERCTNLTIVALVVVLATTAGGTWVVFTYPTESTDSTIPHEGFAGIETDGGPHQVEGAIYTDGELFVAYDAVIDEDGNGILIEEYGGDQFTEEKRYGTDDAVYVMQRTDNVEFAESALADDEYELLDHEEEDGIYTIVQRNDEFESLHRDYVVSTERLLASNTFYTDYERVDTVTEDGEGFGVYEPDESWTIGDWGQGTRYTNVEGKAVVHNETLEMHELDVRFDATDASTYADYHLAADDDIGTIELVYAFEETEVDVDRPAWVEPYAEE